MDRLTREHRSWNMSRIRGKNTAPEVFVRSMLHQMGYRFRLHGRNHPGNPDIVLPKYKALIFVHGCFWHRHDSCKYAYVPKTRIEFWEKKFSRNIERDREVAKQIKKSNWQQIVVWECELKYPEKLSKRLNKLLK